MRYRVVLDTNVLISAIFSKQSPPFQCLMLAKLGDIESVTCQEILAEFTEKLLRKFKFSQEMTQETVGAVRQVSRLVTISGLLKSVPQDADDDMVVECAVLGKATHIVTGDKHLLCLERYQNVEIVTPGQFVSLFRIV